MSERGIGFIVEDGGMNEVEFHWTAMSAGHLDQLQIGQRVQFDTQIDQHDQPRRRAVNIHLLRPQG